MMRVEFYFMVFNGRLNCSNTDGQYAYMQPVSKGSGRVWLCLAARCSQDAFSFLFFTLDLAKTSGYWRESSSDIYFVQILHDVT